MYENGTIEPMLEGLPEYNQWGEPMAQEALWGEAVPASVEIVSMAENAPAEAGERVAMTLAALVEGEGPVFSRCKASRNGEALGEFRTTKRAYYAFVGRTRYELAQP